MNPFKKLIIGMMLLISMPAFAQDDPGDDPDAPIDGGILLLIAGGIGYGVKKAHDITNKDHIHFDKED